MILRVRTREHISCRERPPGGVCNERGHIVHPGHYHQPHKGHSLGKACDLSCCLIAKGVNTESKLSHAANDIMGEVKGHVLNTLLTVGRMHDQGPVCRRSTPLVIGRRLQRPSKLLVQIAVFGIQVKAHVSSSIGTLASLDDINCRIPLVYSQIETRELEAKER
eukprot:1157616-Pelagomonas_calceolata.AAC.6